MRRDGRIAIDVPLELDFKRQDGVRLEWQVEGSSRVRTSGWITSNGSQILSEEVKIAQNVVFLRPDMPPAASIRIRASLESERTVYIIELKFVKVLRKFIAKVMVALQFLVCWVVLWVLFVVVRAFWRRPTGQTELGGRESSAIALSDQSQGPQGEPDRRGAE